MTRAYIRLAAMAGLLVGGIAMGQAGLTDQQVRERIISESRSSYPGNCPCPYDTDRAGRNCGARSAWSRQGGNSPFCFPDDVTDEQVRRWRARNDG